MKRISLSSRLALLFAGCTAVVSLLAGVLFSQASEKHFIELDQQLLDSKLMALRSALQDADTPTLFAQRQAALADELSHQPDLSVRINAADGQRWFDSSPRIPAELPTTPGLHSLQNAGTNYRVYNAP